MAKDTPEVAPDAVEDTELVALKAEHEGKSYAELMDLVDNGDLTMEQLDAIMDQADKTKGAKKKGGSRKTRKYEGDTKEVQCNEEGCEVMVTVTKFASAKSVFCEEHKPAKAGRGSKANYDGPTKVCQCIDCGVDVTVTKFATPASVRCVDCKKVARKKNKVEKTTILYNIGEVPAELEVLRAQKVFSMKPTLFEGVFEVTAQPALLTLLEANFTLVEYIESDAAGE